MLKFLKMTSVASALAIVALSNTGCARLKDDPAKPAPLTRQQKQDLRSVLEGIGAAQAAFPEFEMGSHPSSSKPGHQYLSQEIRNRCRVYSTRRANERMPNHLDASGENCPVAMKFDLTVNDLYASNEERSVAMDFSIRDSSVRPLSTIEKLNLQGSQKSSSSYDLGERRLTVENNVSGTLTSPQLGEGTFRMEFSISDSNSGYGTRWFITQRAYVRMPTFEAVIVAKRWMENGRRGSEIKLNSEALSESELKDLSSLLPRLGFFTDSGVYGY